MKCVILLLVAGLFVQTPSPAEERPRQKAERGAAAALSGGRRRRRAWDRAAGTVMSPRPPRTGPEFAITRGVATAGAVDIATAVAAVMGAAGAAGWLIGVVASLLTLALQTLVRRA